MEDRKWNVEINGVKQLNYDVSEDIARQNKDRLLEKGEPAVSMVKMEGEVKVTYIFKNKTLAKKNFREDD